MSSALLVGGIVVLAIIIIGAAGVRVVQQGQTMVIERLGRYHRILEPGINVIFPVLDKSRKINWKFVKEYGGKHYYVTREIDRIDLRETVYDFPRQNVITMDNVTIEINAMLYFQIMDPYKAVYEIANLPDAIEKLTQTSLRNVIGELELDETLSSRDMINTKLRTILDEATDKWGVKVNRVELQDINPPEDIKNAMEKQMRAEREKREQILLAEGKKQSEILRAEGEKQARITEAEGLRESQILNAEGESKAKERIAEAEAYSINMVSEALKVSGADPSQYLVAIKYVETLQDIAKTNNNRLVFLPYESSSLMGSLGGIKELLNNMNK